MIVEPIRLPSATVTGVVLEAVPDTGYPGLSAWNVFAGPFRIGRISKVADKAFLVSRDAKTFETPDLALAHHLTLLGQPRP